MLNSIDSISNKSFENEKFQKIGKVNCFFGVNGSGKTALAQCVIQKSNNPVCFDTKFVENNILLEDNKNSIQGVKLKVGKQVKIEKEIREIEAQIEIQNHNKSEDEKRRDQLKEQLFDVIQDQLEVSKKEFQTGNKIKQKPGAKSDPVKAYTLWCQDIDANLPADLNNLIDIENEQKLLNMQQHVAKECLDSINRIEIEQFNNYLEKVIPKPQSELTNTMIQWLKNGLIIHNIGQEHPLDKCLFCGNIFDVKEVENRITIMIQSQYSQLISFLNYEEDKIDNALNNIDKNINSGFKSESLPILKESLSSVKKIIIEKRKHSEKETSISDTVTKAIYQAHEKIESFLQKSTFKLKGLEKISLQIENYAKSWIGTQLQSDINLQNIIKEIEERENKISKLTKEIRDRKEKILKLRESQSNLNGFAEICNNKFQELGLRLFLEINTENNGYLIKEKSGLPLNVSDLSEGERRIIAFMEFFYQMHEDTTNIRGNIDSIIIDDPITSLDAENSYEIIEMINDLIRYQERISAQLFIFTNSSQAFHSIGFKDNSRLKRWNIYKDGDGISHIREVSAEDFKIRSNYYQDLFIEIAHIVFQSKNEIEVNDSVRFYCNKARILLESHAYTNYKIDNATSSKNNFNVLMKDYNIPNFRKDRFKKDLDVVNANSHGVSVIDSEILKEPINNIGIQEAIKDIIVVLYCKDKEHVLTMLQSILEGSKINRNRKNLLKQWAKAWKEE